MRICWNAIGILCVGALACATWSCEETTTTNSDSNTTTSNGTSDNSNGSVSVDAECQNICAARADDSRGFCDSFTVANCVTYCQAQASIWDEAVWETFTSCAETDPLCFQVIDQCMLWGLYGEEPEGTVIDHIFTIGASGFDAFEGELVNVVFRYRSGDQEHRDQVNIQDGAFTLQWSFSHARALNSGAAAIVLYIDRNTNGTCDIDGSDLVISAAGQPMFGTHPFEHTADIDPSMAIEGSTETPCSLF